jgi:hypothetical protein
MSKYRMGRAQPIEPFTATAIRSHVNICYFKFPEKQPLRVTDDVPSSLQVRLSLESHGRLYSASLVLRFQQLGSGSRPTSVPCSKVIQSTLAYQSVTKMITHAERSSDQNFQLTCINNCQIASWWYLATSVAEVKQAAAQFQGSKCLWQPFPQVLEMVQVCTLHHAH